MSDPQRRYGFYKCPKCRRGWESSWAWCKRGTNKPCSGQQCKSPGCPNDYIKPYKVQPLRCSICGSTDGCGCRKGQVDPRKPHRSDLCERCIKRLGCNYR